MGMNANGNAGEIDILPRYGLGGADLSRRWIELVRGGHMLASATLLDNGGGDGGTTTTIEDRATGRQGEGRQRPRLLEFVESLSCTREWG